MIIKTPLAGVFYCPNFGVHMATNSLGRLTLDLLVKLGSFEQGMSAAERKAKQSAQNMSNAFKGFNDQIQQMIGGTQLGSVIDTVSTKLSAMRGGVLLATSALAGMAIGGTVVAIGGLSAMAIQLAKSNLELANFAAVSNTSIQTFQGLSGAASSFGITQEKLSDQLKDFNEKIGEFASVGSGGAKDFFEQIAVKTEKGADGAKKLAVEMSKMDGVTALQTYVDKLEEAGVNQQQMSFYLESMGSDLTVLAPLLANGGKLWKNYQEAMEEAGIITGQEAIEKSIELAAQTESVQLQFTALKNQLAQAVMPALSSVIGYFLDGSGKGGQFASVVDAVGYAAKGTAVLVIGLASGVKSLVQIIGGALDAIGNLGQTAINFWNAPTLLGKGKALVDGFQNNSLIIENTAKRVWENTKQAYGGISKTIQNQTGDHDRLTRSIIDNKKAQLDYNKVLGKGVTTGIAQNKALNPTVKAPKVTKTPKAKTDHSAEQAKREQEQLEKAQQSIVMQYADEELKLKLKYEEEKKKISTAYAKDPVNEKLYLSKAKEAYDKDVEAFKQAQQKKREDAFNGINTASGNIVGQQVAALAQTTLSPIALSRFNLNAQQQDGYSQLGDSLNSGLSAINDNELLADQEKYDARLSIYQQYLDAKKAMSEDYAKQDRDLEDQNNAASLAGFGAMFGMMGSLLDNFGAKSSTAYKLAFASQKAFVLASAMLNAKGAVMKAWDDPSNTTFWGRAAAAAAVVVQTNDLMSAIQGVALSGMAHNGIDNIPKEGTWLLDGGERVLNPKQNQDLTRFLNDRESANNGSISIKVDVNDSGVSTSGGNTQDQKQLGQLIGNAVRAVIRQEQRQGGLLSK